MLTELIEEYANRYVEITATVYRTYDQENFWKAEVSSKKVAGVDGGDIEFSFKSYGDTPDKLAINTRRVLDIFDGVIAEREKELRKREVFVRANTEEMRARLRPPVQRSPQVGASPF